MLQDKNGNEIVAGDRVTFTGRVEQVIPRNDICNVLVVPEDGSVPAGRWMCAKELEVVLPDAT